MTGSDKDPNASGDTAQNETPTDHTTQGTPEVKSGGDLNMGATSADDVQTDQDALDPDDGNTTTGDPMTRTSGEH